LSSSLSLRRQHKIKLVLFSSVYNLIFIGHMESRKAYNHPSV
jgi:hypothetical protein